MKIGIDGRAAVWYEGTGMGTYARWLMEDAAAAPALAGSRFYLPSSWFGAEEIGDQALSERAAPTPHFWERIAAEPPPCEEGIELFHNPHNGFGLMEEDSIPLVMTVHDIIPFMLPQYCGEPYGQTFRHALPQWLKRVDAVIAVSQWTKSDLVRQLHVPAEKITVIHEAPESFYRPLPQREVKEFLKRRYDLDPGYVLYLGGFNGRKGVASLIEAFAKIKPELRHSHPLLILGRAEKRFGELNDLARRTGMADDIIFGGFISGPELPYFYNGASLFVYPSLYEGFGLPPLEAASCGTPVLTTSAASLPEVMGEGAHYVPPGDVTALADAIRDLLSHDDKLADLAAKGLKRRGDFSRQQSFAETLALYEKVCRNGSKVTKTRIK